MKDESNVVEVLSIGSWKNAQDPVRGSVPMLHIAFPDDSMRSGDQMMFSRAIGGIGTNSRTQQRWINDNMAIVASFELDTVDNRPLFKATTQLGAKIDNLWSGDVCVEYSFFTIMLHLAACAMRIIPSLTVFTAKLLVS